MSTKKYTVILNHWEMGEWFYQVNAVDAQEAAVVAAGAFRNEQEYDGPASEIEIRYVFDGHLTNLVKS